MKREVNVLPTESNRDEGAGLVLTKACSLDVAVGGYEVY